MPLLVILLKTLTLTKVKVWLNMVWAYITARTLGINSTVSYTPFVTIEPTNRCNLRCPECATGSNQLTRKKGDMDWSVFKNIIDQVAPYTLVLNIYMQGEPFLNAELGRMIAYAKKNNLFVSLSTNANILPQWKAERLPHHLVISVDGAQQKSYEKYRQGGNFETVKTFINKLANWKKDNKQKLPFTELQYLINKYNENEVNATRQLFKGKYDRFVTKKMQIINEENRERFTPTATNNSRYTKAPKLKKGCYKMLSSTVITHDGLLVPCCMDKDADHNYGTITDNNIQTLANNESAKSFNMQVILEKEGIAMCQNCPYA